MMRVALAKEEHRVMRMPSRLRSLALGLAGAALALMPLAAAAQTPPGPGGPPGGGAPAFPPPSTNVTVFATGLLNPRGLKWGPDGSLYVAEGGSGGTNSTAGRCD